MDELQNLRRLSALVGSDPLLVQGAGGNTSLKQDGVMWIKASGTWLKDAETKEIFVPVDLAGVLRGLSENSADVENCVAYLRSDLNAAGLRPSIETTVHALMPHKVVVHVHCVNTISWAVQNNAEVQLALRLAGIDWAFVPYARPGLMLAEAIQARLRPGVNVLVLGNHGLVVAAETVAAAAVLLEKVVEVLRRHDNAIVAADLAALETLARGTDYRPSTDYYVHALATDVGVLDRGKAVVLYPDHVVFLGVGVATAMAHGVPLVAVPGKGVLVHRDAKPSVEPMARCLGDVLRRVPAGEALRCLTSTEIDMLLNWDAEKYRQSLKQS
jgi:rhamnose utilization protein RhaD (predicted bifunctional aldolase and dehydrogenase)